MVFLCNYKAFQEQVREKRQDYRKRVLQAKQSVSDAGMDGMNDGQMNDDQMNEGKDEGGDDVDMDEDEEVNGKRKPDDLLSDAHLVKKALIDEQ
jgi:hypothetical protein